MRTRLSAAFALAAAALVPAGASAADIRGTALTLPVASEMEGMGH
jgi:hypothetical protein